MAVIADDLTGAAEMAGIALRYNLSVQLAMPGVPYTGADLFIVATDSRSMGEIDAGKVTAGVVDSILALQPALIYKKIDSVLRGHVLHELNVQMQRTGQRKAFMLPANPSLGRTISDGDYYVDGSAISQTGFATDPEFAITDSSVLKMIGAASGEERLVKQTDLLPEEGIVIGEAVSIEEVKAWARKVDQKWVLAGAGDFFAALLEKKYKSNAQSQPVSEMPHLYVSGTAFNASRALIKEISKVSRCVAYLPESIMRGNNAIDQDWLRSVIAIIGEQQKCVIAIEDNGPLNIPAADLRRAMARAVKAVTDSVFIREMFIEGGSTSAAILHESGIASLEPVNELARGVVRMKAGNMYITVKPGSYIVPAQIKKMYL